MINNLLLIMLPQIVSGTHFKCSGGFSQQDNACMCFLGYDKRSSVGMPSWTLCVLFAGLGGLHFERRRTRTTRSVEDGIPTEDRGNE
jgi:hypothetical protein